MKKIVSMVLTVVMVFSLMSGVALASPTKACAGKKIGTFNGSQACVDASGNLHICENNFPDEKFRDYINYAFDDIDNDDDSLLTEDEVSRILDIGCYGLEIKDLRGIEFFTAITELECEDNQLTTLDMSKNTALEYLYCYNNKLTSLNVRTNKALVNLNCNNNQLKELDVAANTSLASLYCYTNNLVKLDVSKNKELEDLECSNNKLKVLDLRNNAVLKYLHCQMNQFDSLNISTNRQLLTLYCSYNNLTRLDTSKNTDLVYLECIRTEFTTLDVTKNVKLEYLVCHTNKLKALDVSKNIELERLECQDNNINNLDVSKNTSLQYLYCYNNQLEKLELGSITSLSMLDCCNNQLSSLNIKEGQNSPCVKSYGQHKENVEYNKEGSTYKVNIGKIVGSTNINNIKSVSAKSKSGANLTASFNNKTGMATFTQEPSTVTYIYNVRDKSEVLGNMDVTLHMKTTGHTVDHRTNTTVTRATMSEDGSISTYCAECKKTVSKAVIPRVSSIKLKESSATYNGKVNYPTVVVKDRTGKTLKKDTDYKVSYKSFKKNVGIYTVTVTFTGNYVGTKTLNYTIKPVTSSISKLTAGSKKFTVKWSKKVTEVTGYEIQYSKSSKFSSAKTVTIGKNTSTTSTISKLTGKSKYYVRIRTYKTVKVSGKAVKIYSDWSKPKTVTTKK